MDEAELQRIAVDYTEAWNSGNPNRVASFYDEGGSLTVNDGEAAVGRTAIAEVVRGFMVAFPDLVLEFDGLEHVSHRIQYHWTFKGTNTGAGGTGNAVDFSGFESWVFSVTGLIFESLGSFDAAEYEQQLTGNAR
ncbi:MAG: hypothetical protein Cons2KO_02160 [Congregibacter sp.]